MYDFEGPDGLYYNSAYDYVWIGLLGFCGCGDPDRYREPLMSLLEYFDNNNFQYRELSDVELLLSYILDSKGLTEHGSSLTHCQLTERGKMAKELMSK